jgi:hypothetical protein
MNGAYCSSEANDQFDSDNFSKWDMKQGIAPMLPYNPNFGTYLGTPSGVFKSYNPNRNMKERTCVCSSKSGGAT